MANVHIDTDFTITDVKTANNASGHTWYQVLFLGTWPDAESTMYVTPMNDERFPLNLAKADFLANVLPEVTAYNNILCNTTSEDLTDWKTED